MVGVTAPPPLTAYTRGPLAAITFSHPSARLRLDWFAAGA